MLTSRPFAALLVLLMALLATMPTAQAGTCNGRPCIQVGAFNIKLFGTTGPADTPAEYEEIARLIGITMDLDVFVLEEINVKSPRWAALRTVLEKHGYAIAFESAFGGELEQYVVIGYRKSSVTLTAPAAIDLNFPTTYSEAGTKCTYPNVRPPVTAAFRAGNFDFRIVGVHLKSQKPVTGDLQCDDRIRTDQARRIVAHIGSIAADEKDVIILGDFNSEFVAPENDPFRSAGFMSAMGDRAPGSGTISFQTSPKGLIDQIVFRSSDPSYVRHSGLIYNLTPQDRKFYLASISDHVPVRAAFYTDTDPD